MRFLARGGRRAFALRQTEERAGKGARGQIRRDSAVSLPSVSPPLLVTLPSHALHHEAHGLRLGPPLALLPLNRADEVRADQQSALLRREVMRGEDLLGRGEGVDVGLVFEAFGESGLEENGKGFLRGVGRVDPVEPYVGGCEHALAPWLAIECEVGRWFAGEGEDGRDRERGGDR